MHPFAAKNNSVRLLGFKTYQEYLKSDMWKELRKKVFKIRGKQCEACGSKRSLNVHHTKYGYKYLTGQRTSGMFVLCQLCHKEVHDIIGSRNNFGLYTRRYIKKMKAKGDRTETD